MSYPPQDPYQQHTYQQPAYQQPGYGYPPPGYDPGPPPPPPQPRGLRWVGTLTYLQFVGALLGSILSIVSAKEASDPGTSGPAIDTDGAIILSGIMLLLTVSSLLSAVLLSRRDRWVRTLSAVVQAGFVASLVAAPLLMLDSHVAVLLFFTAPAAGAAVLAVVNLILLSRPSSGQWYAWEG